MNVVLYVLDSLRADHVSAYGYDRETTPKIDRLAAEGVLFEDCISPSTWTRPAAASVFSGLYPPVHRCYFSNHHFSIPFPTLTEQLRDRGYDTIAITSGNMSSRFGFDIGFDTYIDDIDVGVPDQAENTDEEGTRGREINDHFADWLDERDSSSPFFAMCWSTGTHMPLVPPDGYRKYLDPSYTGRVDGSMDSFSAIRTEEDVQQLRNYYDDEIRFNDACVGEFCDQLRSRGLYEDTLFILVSDHGQLFGEHGTFGHGPAHFPFPGLVHVPCIVRTPNSVQDHRVSEQVNLADLYPSILELVGGESDTESLPVQGQSFAPALEGEQIEGLSRNFAVVRSDEQMRYATIRSQEWQYVVSDTVSKIEPEDGDGSTDQRRYPENKLLQVATVFFEKPLERQLQILRHPFKQYKQYTNRVYKRRTDREFLFDLRTNKGERTDCIESEPETAQRLADELSSWFDSCGQLRETLGIDAKTVHMDDDITRRLQKLGYLQDETTGDHR